jgi:hypothetical protein
MAYRVKWRESWVLSAQLFGNGRVLRRVGEAQLIPEVMPVAQLALANLDLDETIAPAADTRAYPLYESFTVGPLTARTMVRLLKIEQGRLIEPEVFGGVHVDQGISTLKRNQATYLVARQGDETLGAVGYIHEPTDNNVRVIELVARDDSVKGSLLRLVVEEAEQKYEADLIECDVSAYSPRIQRTLLDLGFVPAAYAPGMVFHQTARWDVVRFIKLNVAWDLGPLMFTESGQRMFDTVAPVFARAEAQRARKQLALGAHVLEGLTPLEVEFVERASDEIAPAPGTLVKADALHIVLAGQVAVGTRGLVKGESFGEGALLGQAEDSEARTGAGARLLKLTRAGLESLSDKHPRLGLRLYRNLAMAK